MNSIGCDPGKSGGLALLASDGSVIDVCKIPEGDRDLLDVLDEWKRAGPCRARLEFVRSSPQMGVTSAFTFGDHFGRLRMALTASRIPFDVLTPAKWQVGFNLPTRTQAGGETAKKRAHKVRAQQLFPDTKITHATADALLIAESLRRTA